MQVLRQLPAELERRNIGLVVLDSIAMLARLEHDSRAMIARQKLLAEQSSLLKQAAERFGIPVVVTNQVTAGTDASDGQQRAALGVVWAHAVNTRLVLDQHMGMRRLQVSSCAVPACVTGLIWMRSALHGWSATKALLRASMLALVQSCMLLITLRSPRKGARGHSQPCGTIV